MEKKLKDKLISAAAKRFAAEFQIFDLATIENYKKNLHMGPQWSATYDGG